MTAGQRWSKERPTFTPSVQVEWNRETKSWDQVWARIQTKLKCFEGSDCWMWMGVTNGGKEWERYGRIYICNKAYRVHRIVYELFKGPIPAGLVLDHLCRVTDCVNPEHLEAVTDLENIMRGNAPGLLTQRKGVCINGHERTTNNMRMYKGRLLCKACERERSARRRNHNAVDER